MSIFGSIVNKIFGHAHGTAEAAPSGEPTGTTSSAAPTLTPANFNNPQSAPQAPGSTTQTASAGSSGGSAPGSTAASAGPSGSGAPVDVSAVLNDLAAKNTQKLDWRHSILDLMKLLGLDSSLSARQELARELHYSGSMEDSAAMNIWLHKQVMQKPAENGGKVPDDLK